MFQLGYWGLFLASFLAATIVPFSSEAILSGMLAAGYSPVISLILATAGNWLGGLTSYYIGFLGKEQWITRYLRIDTKKTDQFKNYVKGKETWIAFFCWLPFIGDVIAVALGLLKVNPFRVALGMLIGKAIRYLFWAYFTLSILKLT